MSTESLPAIWGVYDTGPSCFTDAYPLSVLCLSHDSMHMWQVPPVTKALRPLLSPEHQP